MSNKFPCGQCIYFDQKRNQLKEFWYGWCKLKSIYPLDSNLHDVNKGENPKPIIVGKNNIMLECNEGIAKKP